MFCEYSTEPETMVIEAKPSDCDDHFMTADEVAARHRKDVRTLANERSRGEGIPYTKLGGKVLYRLTDVLAAERDGLHGFTWAGLREAVLSFKDIPPPIAERLVEHVKEEMTR